MAICYGSPRKLTPCLDYIRWILFVKYHPHLPLGSAQHWWCFLFKSLLRYFWGHCSSFLFFAYLLIISSYFHDNSAFSSLFNAAFLWIQLPNCFFQSTGSSINSLSRVFTLDCLLMTSKSVFLVILNPFIEFQTHTTNHLLGMSTYFWNKHIAFLPQTAIPLHE